MSLAELKSKSKTNLESLKAAAKKENTKKSSFGEKDPRFWTLERDETGEASALIRFLPVSEKDDKIDGAQPWVKVLSHGFKNETTGKWYIENSLTTIGQKDPVFEFNRKLYNEKKEDQAKKQKRKSSFYSNIYIVRDPRNPENEGKVFLFKYGQQIFAKIMAKLAPDEDLGEEAKDPFDFWNGMDFKLKIKTVDKYPNYNSSEFTEAKAIASKSGVALTDAEIEVVYGSAFSLQDFLKPENFKTFDELKGRLDEVLADEDEVITDKTSKRVEENRRADKADVDVVEDLENVDVSSEVLGTEDIDKLIEDL